ncbi:OstA-like protein [Mucilaginibacter sp. L3T2-6]|uniref:OstA-like protein n=1 Tax=Mucilaginibacter sp. L3T2-6 TaxID=3062491 RepID=UPI002675DF88|nr:OstA-like protein [Mucilaginibacter sp. L3T2-6]MDO3642270.1 OstA-like protein [Mucilaginibacter sp. L3T2-6]MDV6214765.1 OstA-like protein [Mucilaginibacter sp. L3T2-6]
MTAFCQKKTLVKLIKSSSTVGVKLNGKEILKVYQGTFQQDFSTLSSDSAYFYQQDNAFDAFGNVVINQGDTLHVFSDKLNYNGNTKIAILTDNVKMVDKDATLTTNYLTYNTATRIGTYTDGGKLVNKDNTLLSKNGYYFARSRDSYFRYNVSLTTPDALVKTDTMRYNTGSKIAYFYGPTHIYGIQKAKEKKEKKDNDTLYTENGTYNTTTEQAAFGKNNLYTSGSKSLKGDSLFYDKLKGYGRAVKHVTFVDLEQKTTIKGNLGTYFKDEERAVVTEDPYIILVTEQKDTSRTDSLAKADSARKADSTFRINPEKQQVGQINMAQLIRKTVPGKADTVTNANSLKRNIELTKNGKIKVDSVIKKLPADTNKVHKKIDSVNKKPPGELKNVNLKTVQSKIIPKTKVKAETGKTDDIIPLRAGQPKNALPVAKAVKDTGRIKRDSVYMSADTIETQILTYKNLRAYQEKQRLAHIRDTSAKPKAKTPDSKFLSGKLAGVPLDTSFLHRDFFGKPKVVAKKPVVLTKKQLAADSLRKKRMDDSVALARKLEPSDTARIRIVIAHHHFKMFKSDMQAKADSMFYSGADSTIRCYVNPMIWTEGSQLSGDTIYLQMKHKKMDNMSMFLHAFIVNIDKQDSTHFNQMAGKKMRGYFKDDKLHKMLIDGNAETIYFARDSAKNKVTGMERSLSTRIGIDFENNKVTRAALYLKPENKYTPIDKVQEDDKILKGFIWKPKERPVSKESIIPSFSKKAEAKAAKDKGKPGKATDKKTPVKGGKAVKDTTGAGAVKLPGAKSPADSLKIAPPKPSAAKNPADSANRTAPQPQPVKANKDSSKAAPVKMPVGLPKKDTTRVKQVKDQ